jgi:hypothetical protein
LKLIKKHSSQKYWIGYTVIISLSMGVWLVGNVIVSGWLCYPVSSIDLFHFDWKTPKEVSDMERFSVKQWGKVPFQDIQVTAQMSFGEWFPLCGRKA